MLTHPEINPVRVLHIVGDSRYGGIVQIILGLGRIVRMDGWQVDVLTTDPAVQQAVRQHGLGVVSLDVVHRAIRPLWDLAGLLRLRSFLRRERYGIVHTHTSKGGFVGRLAAWLAGVPVIVHTAHGFAFHEGSPSWVRIFFTRLERIASRWCDRVVSVSEFHRSWALELGICAPPEIIAIPNGITPLSRSSTVEPSVLRHQLGLGAGELLLLSPARLAPDKGLSDLIEAVTMLPPGGRAYRVMIAGDGPIRARLEQLARDRGVAKKVTFLGFRQDIGDLLAACDIVVLPSLREGMSISLLEAMAAGKPIIATSIGSHRELASQAEMARLVPPASPRALAEAIEELAREPELTARLASAAQTLFATRYTEDRMLRSYRDLYHDLVKRKSFTLPSRLSVRQATAVRTAHEQDIAAIVAIHQKAFSEFFLTRMGAEFLRLYYQLVLHYHAGIVLVSEGARGLEGFVCGFVDPAEFYRLMWRNRRAFALPALGALLRHPSLAANVAYGVRRIQTSASQGPPRLCELSSIAVAPEASGNGLGKRLLRAFLAHSWSMDAHRVYLTTDADCNEGANALYREVGFQQARRFLQRKGRWMNEYVIHRSAAEERQEVRP